MSVAPQDTDVAQPLAGVRVLHIATFVAAPCSGIILAECGADVIKIEQPDDGDPLCKLGTPTECGDTLVWLSEARNKGFVTQDLRVPEGREVFLKLVTKSDALLENFRPDTMEKSGLSFETLRKVNPRIILLRVSAYGQTGPYREKPGFARVAHGFGSLSHLAGMADGPPVVPGSTSLADYLSSLWGALGVLMTLRVAECTDEGQVIDVSLYESIFRLLDELVAGYAKLGEVRSRLRPDVSHVVPPWHWHWHWQRSRGQVCGTGLFERKNLRTPGGSLGTTGHDRRRLFATNAQRLLARAEINAAIAGWTGRFTLEEAVACCEPAGEPFAPFMAIDDIFANPHAARGNLQWVQDPRVGDLVVPAAIPLKSRTPAQPKHLGGALGAHAQQVLAELLGLDVKAVARLSALHAVDSQSYLCFFNPDSHDHSANCSSFRRAFCR